ncbi:MAG: MBL fold metallo-hydrolase [Actinomycetota bacterium]|nr:MBL fold metallo-hydrolase [Actinomycetota bacterium]
MYEFESGSCFTLNDFEILSVPLPHDARDPVGFVISDGERKAGIATDLGMVTRVVVDSMSGCNALVIESNYDEEMLDSGPYPPFLKERVRSNTGHLSNEDALSLIKLILSEELGFLFLAHLSETNNRPWIPQNSVGATLREAAVRTELLICFQSEPTEVKRIS